MASEISYKHAGVDIEAGDAFVRRIRGGKKPYIRKMQGLIGIEEAAGRCAEMGQRFAEALGCTTLEVVP